MVVLRADPWNPDYGMGFDASGQEEPPAASVDTELETADWSKGVPASGPPTPLWFVDGVRRVELRVLADSGGRRAAGLFGSYAVGSVRCDGRASFGEHRVCRALVVGSGVAPDRVVLPAGHATLAFEPATDQRHDPNAPLDRLQRLMREAEAALVARSVLPPDAIAVVDGPLNFYDEPSESVVGVVKRFVRHYLPPEREALLGRLRPSERTPVFALLDPSATPRWYSWYARIAALRTPWHDHAGIVRCEVGAGTGLDRAVGLAEVVTAALPGFAGRPSDPRAPQNLAPVGALETWLRHRMGDRRLIRRAITTWLVAQPAEEVMVS
jgi:hypothetical protein